MSVEAKPIFLMPTARRDNTEISRRFPTSSPDHQVLHGSKEGLRATHHSRSRTTAADFKSFNANSTLALSNDISGSRISQEIIRPSSSIYLHRERSDNLAKSLMARGSKLLKRQNSTASLKTWQWLETSHDGTGVYESQLAHGQDGLAHSRIRSTGNIPLRSQISQPYNFQHLTHTYANQLTKLEKASHSELVSKFSAIRASQVPDSELKGIKAENLHVQNLSVREHQPEPSSPNSIFSFSTPPLSPSSPRRPQNHRLNSSRTSFGSLSHSRSIESFSQPGSRPYKSPPTAIVPPPRVSSKRSTPELNAHQSSTSTLIKPCSASKNPTSPISPTSCTVLEWEDELIDYSTAPHAVSTPDETALTLMPAPSGTVRTELSDVPEENEVSRWRKAPALMSYPSTPRSGLGHSKSFSTTLSSPHRGSIGSYSTSAYSPISPMSDAPHWTESVIPLVDQQLDDIPTQPMLSRCISVSLNGSEFCWEDDIDYCYEHAAEADCEFDWERVTKNEETAAKIINSPDSNAETAKESLRTVKHEVSNNPSPLTGSYLRFSTIDSEAPILKPKASPRDSTKSSTDSLAGPITPSRSNSSPLGSALPLGPSKRPNPPDFTPSLFVSGDFETAIMPEEMYQRILSGDHVSEQHYAFGSDCLDAPSTRDSSPRSSHLPVSKSNSQESFFLSQSISSLYRHRDSSSVSSLPELVYSRKEAPNSDFVVADVGDPITAPVNSAPPPGVLPTPQVRPRRSTSLAKEVAHLSVLQKIMGSSAVLTQEKILPSAPHYHQLHQEKPLPLTPS